MTAVLPPRAAVHDHPPDVGGSDGARDHSRTDQQHDAAQAHEILRAARPEPGTCNSSRTPWDSGVRASEVPIAEGSNGCPFDDDLQDFATMDHAKTSAERH